MASHLECATERLIARGLSPRARGEPHWVHVPVDTTAAPSALMIRTAGAAQLLMPTVRRIIQDEAPGTVVDLRTVAQMQDEQERNYRLAASGVSAAGLIALGLSAIGLYAVVAFSVAQRTREIAVRMAVGGGRHRIAARFLVDGLRLSLLGLTLGLPLSVLGLRLLMIDADLPRVPLPMVTAIAALGVLLVAAAAAWVPARRAASVDPAVTLRAES